MPQYQFIFCHINMNFVDDTCQENCSSEDLKIMSAIGKTKFSRNVYFLPFSLLLLIAIRC